MDARETAGRFLRSAGAAAVSQFWRVGVALAAELLLRRWIPVDDWGLFDWALTIFLVLGAVRDLGLVYHVARVQPRPYGNLLATELVWGGGIVAAVVAGAPQLARLFRDGHPAVVPVIQAMALFLLFEGLATVPRVFFEYELRIGRAVLPEITRNLVFFSLALALAWGGWGVWSMVVAQVVSAAVYAAHLWWRAHGEIELHYARGQTLALVRESLPLAFIWFLLILIENVDPLILGKRFAARTVGEYGFAYKWAFRVKLILLPAIARALYPAVVAFAAAPRQMFQAYRMATLALFAIEVPAAYFLFVNAGLVLALVGGEQWVDAPAFLAILCFAQLVDPFSRLGGEVLKALHRERLWIASSLVTLAAFAGGGWVLSGRLGPEGMAWANYLPLGAAIMAWALHRVAPGPFRRLVGELALVYLVPLPLFAAAAWAGGERPWLRLALSCLAGALALGFYYRRFGASFIAFFRDPVTAAGDEPAAAPPA